MAAAVMGENGLQRILCGCLSRQCIHHPRQYGWRYGTVVGDDLGLHVAECEQSGARHQVANLGETFLRYVGVPDCTSFINELGPSFPVVESNYRGHLGHRRVGVVD